MADTDGEVTSETTVGHIVNQRFGPPENELPAGIDTGARWITKDAAVAVPSGLVYSAGVLLMVTGRIRLPPATSIQEAAQCFRDGVEARPNSEGLRLTANGRSGSGMGGEYRGRSWPHQIWVRFPDGGPGVGIVLALEWPAAGIAASEQLIAGDSLADAAARVITLWPAGAR